MNNAATSRQFVSIKNIHPKLKRGISRHADVARTRAINLQPDAVATTASSL